MKRALPENRFIGSGRRKTTPLEFPPEVVDDPGMRSTWCRSAENRRWPSRGKAKGVFEIVEDHRGRLSGGLHRPVRRSSLCSALFPEEVPVRDPHGAERSATIHDRLKAAKQDYEVRYGRKKRDVVVAGSGKRRFRTSGFTDSEERSFRVLSPLFG